jgi:thiol-disulfide isomerase/thioredoxin
VLHASQDSDALSLIRTKRLEAKADNRVLVVYVGATWCPPCKKFKEEIASGRLDQRLSKTTLLEFDVDKDGDRLAAAGYTFKFVPFVALPGADGHPAETQEATGKGSNAWTELMGKLDSWQK